MNKKPQMLFLQRRIRKHLSLEPCHLSNEKKMGFRNAVVLVAPIVKVHLHVANLLLNQQGLLILVQLQFDTLGDNESSYDYFQHRKFLHKRLFPTKTSFSDSFSCKPDFLPTLHSVTSHNSVYKSTWIATTKAYSLC